MKLIKNSKVLQNGELQRADILIDGKVTKQIAPATEPSSGIDIIDVRGHFVSPGLVDVHVHLRKPGGEYKETIETGTRAAARGGFITACPTPNTRPIPDSVEHFEALQKLIDDNAQARVLPYVSITIRQLGKELVDFPALVKEGALAFTDDGVGVQTVSVMCEDMIKATEINKATTAHCKDDSSIYDGAMREGKRSKELGIPGISNICESVQVARDVLLAEAAGCYYRVCHISTKENVRVVRDAKRVGIHVTAKATPYHLLLTEDDIPGDNAIYKMNPSLRSIEDREALLKGLLNGAIGCIATDHAPRAHDEKAQPMERASLGIVGSETAFPLLYTHFVKNGDWTLQQLVDYLTIKPCKTFNLKYGALKESDYADLTIIDLDDEQEIKGEGFLSKADNTPSIGYKIYGNPILTMVEGEIRSERNK